LIPPFNDLAVWCYCDFSLAIVVRNQNASCQLEILGQRLIAFAAQAVDLSAWQDVQGLGILYFWVIVGEIKRKVWAWTKAPGTPSD
jgi:hypothetical protein